MKGHQPSRMEQLGNLLTAMIAVIVSGKADLLVGDSSKIDGLSGGFLVLPLDLMRKFRAGGPHCGTLAQIAREIGVSPGVLRNVFRGKARSRHIANAILTTIVRLEGERALDLVYTKSSAYDPPFTQKERRQFGLGGRYYGVQSKVRARLNVSPDAVSCVVRGETCSRSILAALREEMKEADSAPAAFPDPSARPFSKEERNLFSRGRKYFGVYGRVASRFKVQRVTVYSAAAGHHRSERILAAIRAEMARVDAEIATRGGGQ